MGLESCLADESAIAAVACEALAVEKDDRLLLLDLGLGSGDGKQIEWIQTGDEFMERSNVHVGGLGAASTLKVVNDCGRGSKTFKAVRTFVVLGPVDIGLVVLIKC
jgi:hypothetical protein